MFILRLKTGGISVQRRVEPIRERHGAKVDVIVRSRGAIDDDWSNQSVAVLDRIMRMIPRSAVLRCLELVGSGLAWGERAFSETGGTVHFVRTQLSKTVPVDTRPVVFDVVGDGDFNIVTPVRNDCLHSVRNALSVWLYFKNGLQGQDTVR